MGAETSKQPAGQGVLQTHPADAIQAHPSGAQFSAAPTEDMSYQTDQAQLRARLPSCELVEIKHLPDSLNRMPIVHRMAPFGNCINLFFDNCYWTCQMDPFNPKAVNIVGMHPEHRDVAHIEQFAGSTVFFLAGEKQRIEFWGQGHKLNTADLCCPLDRSLL